ncbi:MAG: hypothetical protein ABUL73_03465 [Alphaproteobacteria bacterium]
MFDRAYASLIATAAACAAVGVAVVATGFALYALALPWAGAAGAAAIVAGVAAIAVIIYAVFAHERAKAKERAAQEAQAALMESVPTMLGDLTRDHPFLTVGLSLLGGVLATRHPQITRDLLSILSTWANRRA